MPQLSPMIWKFLFMGIFYSIFQILTYFTFMSFCLTSSDFQSALKTNRLNWSW